MSFNEDFYTPADTYNEIELDINNSCDSSIYSDNVTIKKKRNLKKQTDIVKKFEEDEYKLLKMLGYDSDESNGSDITQKNQICNNPLCDHKEETKVEMSCNIKAENISDLICLGMKYHCKTNKEYYGLNLRILCNLVTPLKKLESLIGMESVKSQLVNHIVFFLQRLNQKDNCGNCKDCSFGLPCPKNVGNDMLHTIITGPPGVGKTELGKILGETYKEMGILSKGHMKIVTRSDLVGKYLGHTASKTQNVINQCKGGVMFIDEAYALGNPEGRDSFSKECLDTLNQNLSERRDFLCIIAGYKDSLDSCFFTYNPGLKRRFPFSYNIDGYSAEELKDIFLLKVQKESWKTEFKVDDIDKPEIVMDKHKKEQDVIKFFRQNINQFPHFGGDIETFFLNCKICHSNRVVFLPYDQKKILTLEDIIKGFDMYIKNKKFKDSLNNGYGMLYS